MKKLFKYLLSLIVLSYLGFCAVVYFYPQQFFYNPLKTIPDIDAAHQKGYPAEKVEYKSTDGKELYAWFTKPVANKPVIVFMHGNSHNIGSFCYKLIPFVKDGFGTMLPEYRGFGGIDGIITDTNLAQDAIAAIDYLHSLGYKNSDIILYGMSLGSFMATNSAYQLQKEGDFKALILEVPFDNLPNVVKAVFPLPMPLKYIVKDKYDNLSKIVQINSPLLVMGGANDHTVPVFLAENLYKNAAEPKKMIIYPGGGHSNLFDFKNYQDILSWLKKVNNEKTRPQNI